jgi:tetratricopeptide (TPR) repeat protein
MSTLVMPSQTMVDKIPLGRRIAEIMKEKGAAYSQTAMAARLKVCRETFRQMLKGEREIYTFEMDKIVRDLKVSEDRILQQDILEAYLELDKLLLSGEEAEKALKIISLLLDSAIGVTEKCMRFFQLGCVYKNLHQYENAHNAFLTAYSYALEIKKRYNETDILFKVASFLVTSHTIRKEYYSALELISICESTYYADPSKLGSLLYTRSEILKANGDLQEAKNVAYQCLESCIESKNIQKIGKAMINVADLEYKLKNYEVASQQLFRAIDYLSSDYRTRLIAKKELSKSLIKTGEYNRAITIIEEALEELREMSYPELEGKFLILLSRAKHEIGYAEEVLGEEKYSDAVRLLASKYLANHFKTIGDAINFMKYYSIAERFMQSHSDILDEEEL